MSTHHVENFPPQLCHIEHPCVSFILQVQLEGRDSAWRFSKTVSLQVTHCLGFSLLQGEEFWKEFSDFVFRVDKGFIWSFYPLTLFYLLVADFVAVAN